MFRNIQVLGSLPEVLCDSIRPTKMIAEQEIIFGKTEKRYSSKKLLKDTFKLMNLNKIEHSKD